MTLLYREHPSEDFTQTNETRGLSFSLDKEVATNYARDFYRAGHTPSYVTTVEFSGVISKSSENNFRGPQSFEHIVNRFPKNRYDAVRTGDGILVVVYNCKKLKVLQKHLIDYTDEILSKEPRVSG